LPHDTDDPRAATTSEPDSRLYAAISEFLNETRAHQARLVEESRARYTSLEERMTALEQSFAWAVEAFQARADDIHRDTAYVRVIAKQTFAAAGKQLPQAPAPSRDAPRPMAIDRACAAEPGSGEQRVDLCEYGLTIYVMPGDDPARVWDTILQSIHERHTDGC
jgi:hypothetical protein